MARKKTFGMPKMKIMPKMDFAKMAGVSKKDLGLPSFGPKRRRRRLGSKAYFKKMLKDV